MHAPLPRTISIKKFLPAILLLLIIAALAYQTIPKNKPAQEYLRSLQALSFNKYLHLPTGYSSIERFPNWDVYLFTAPEFRCVLGGSYALFAHPGTETDKTVVWLQPGEECWPGHPNCGKSTDDPAALAYAVSGADQGPFSPTSADGDNPVANWNYIYVPTCDGSFHFGDAAADYDADGAPDHWHNGLRQTSAAISLVKELFPDTQKILIAGSSNGGYGTFGAAPIARLVFPEASLYVLNDSGPGIFQPDAPALWPTLINTWNLTPMLPTDCLECKDQLAYLYDWLLARDTRLKIGLFTSYQDEVVSSVIRLSPSENQKLMLVTTGKIHQRHPATFQRYLIQGGSHCINDYYQKVNGITVWDWLGYLVNDDTRWSEVIQ